MQGIMYARANRMQDREGERKKKRDGGCCVCERVFGSLDPFCSSHIVSCITETYTSSHMGSLNC